MTAGRPDVEAAIRALLAAGDARGATTLAVRTFGPELLGYLRALLGDEGDAKDAFSAACERLWRGLATFRGECSLRTWTFQLAWSAASDLRRDRWRMRKRRLETSRLTRCPRPRGPGPT